MALLDGTGSIYTRIRAMAEKLPATEARIARYILEHPDEVIRQSITEIAETCGCAEATIFRLSKRLGLQGFQALKIALASETSEPSLGIHEEVHETDAILSVAEKIFRANIQSIEDTLSLLDAGLMEKAVSLISGARRLEFYGCGGSAMLAQDGYHKFMRTGIPCIAQTDSHFQVMSAALLGPQDVVIAISHSGTNKDIYEAVAIAASRGAKTISVTDYSKTPIGRISDVCLVATSRESRYRTESMAARFAQLSILDALYVAVAIRRQQETITNLAEIRKVIAKKRF